MGGENQELQGPDLKAGIELDSLADGEMMVGHADGEAVLLVRRGEDVFAIGATCTHYSGPLAEGLLVDDTVRCPWHHACFSLRTGEAVRAPALNPVARYRVEQRDHKVFVTGRIDAKPDAGLTPFAPEAIVIVGAGAAGDAAADVLRREGYAGSITMIGSDPDAPYDRPNVSKDFLAGNAPEEWMPLRAPDWYDEQDIDLVLGRTVTAIDPEAGTVRLDDGSTRAFDRLLLATGAEPVRLPVPGADLPHVFTLRSLADCRAIIERASSGTAVVVGAGFIGMEVAASLRARDLDVHVVAPEARPLERVFGAELGDLLREEHESAGVVFHLERSVDTITSDAVELDDGSSIEADLVVVGIGVRPRTALAKAAGLEVDNGVVVNEYLETGHRGIFAAGDVARWPDHRSGDAIRVEHWVVAQRMGQVAARNMLGHRDPFDSAPFFWTHQHEVAISYVGHAPSFDDTAVDGDVGDRDATIAFRRDGRTLAVATVHRDRASLEAEVALERDDEKALGSLVGE